MKIIISDIPPEGLDLDTSIACESDAVASPVRAHLRIDKADTEVYINGDLSVCLKLECSRCLKEFQTVQSVPVDAVYHPVNELAGEDTHEIKSEELNMDFYSGDELDLSTLVKEQIELNFPMKPLCENDCKGICPDCGADLNTNPCECGKKKIDPRFAGLSKLLK